MKRTDSLLAVIAVLLAVNVVSRFVEPQQAQAQTLGVVGPEKTVVGGSSEGSQLFRFWSDGSVDVTAYLTSGPCQNDIQCTAPLLPSVCAAADFDGSGIVGFEDLLAVITEWGGCEPKPKS